MDKFQFLRDSIVLEDDLIDGVNCTTTTASITEFPPDLFTLEQRRSGFLTFHFIIIFFIFYMLAIICDEYFVPSVERIAKELKLPTDIAGCTVMGIANSSPELFTNIVGTFVTKSDLGIGTIVGASVFNILAVAACVGLCTKKPVSVSWWSISRDSFFYLASVLVLYQALLDREIMLLDPIFLLGLYVVYIIVICFNSKLRKCTKRVLHSVKRPSSFRRYNVQNIMGISGIAHQNNSSSIKTLTSATSVTIEESVPPTPTSTTASDCQLCESPSSSLSDEDDVEKMPEDLGEVENLALCGYPPTGSSLTTWLDFIVGWPIRLFLKITIPDCKSKTWEKWYFATFFMCIAWNTLLCYLVSWMTTIIGFTIGIPDTLLGLTVIAAGTSIPQALSSIIVARKGLGTMAMNNAIGSNIFNVLVCFGAPWLIQIIISESKKICVQSYALEYSTLMLICSMILLYILLAANNFYFDKKIGIIALICYLIFIVIGSLFELNVIL